MNNEQTKSHGAGWLIICTFVPFQMKTTKKKKLELGQKEDKLTRTVFYARQLFSSSHPNGYLLNLSGSALRLRGVTEQRCIYHGHSEPLQEYHSLKQRTTLKEIYGLANR